MKGTNLLLIGLLGVVLVAGVYEVISRTSIGSGASSPSPMPVLINEPATPVAKAQKQMKQYSQFPGELTATELHNKKAVIQTTKGKIEFEIFPDTAKAASNFIFLTKDNFYDGLIFHRVVPGFVIQGGDPRGDGTGGPGYQFGDEPVTRKYDRGIVAMANSGPNTNGSQFFIMLEDNPSLPPSYTIFGKVVAGQEVVDKIAVRDVMEKVTIENNTAP